MIGRGLGWRIVCFFVCLISKLNGIHSMDVVNVLCRGRQVICYCMFFCAVDWLMVWLCMRVT